MKSRFRYIHRHEKKKKILLQPECRKMGRGNERMKKERKKKKRVMRWRRVRLKSSKDILIFALDYRNQEQLCGDQ